MNSQPVGILLAAGQSQRFGSHKLLHPVKGGTPMLMTTAKKLVQVLPGSVVVINKKLIPFTNQLEQLGLRVILNQKAEHGIGSSIACAIQASADASGWLITLADMPYIKTETITLLVNKLNEGAGIVAPVYQQQRGHPVGFSQHYKEQLVALNNDIGARDIIAKHRNQLELITTSDAGVVIDIDELSDLMSTSDTGI